MVEKKFGKLTVIKQVDKPKHLKKNGIYWLCKCDCGNYAIVITANLKNGNSKSCGCNRKKSPPNKLNLIGKKFGRLTVIEEDGRDNFQRCNWKCKCDCGNIITVSGNNLKSGTTNSCGCIVEDNNRKRIKDFIGKKFGRLTVIEVIGIVKRTYKYLCECECGNIKEVFGYYLVRTTRPTLSCGCLQKEKMRKRCGENSPSWKGGKNKEERRIDGNCYYYRKFKKSVRKRDKVCKICGNKKSLCIHHLDGYNWCEEKRYDVDNGVLLCFDCHNEFHKNYGKGNNTKDQYDEWTTRFSKRICK